MTFVAFAFVVLEKCIIYYRKICFIIAKQINQSGIVKRTGTLKYYYYYYYLAIYYGFFRFVESNKVQINNTR